MKLKIHHYLCLVAAIAILFPCRVDATWGFTSVKSYGATGNGLTDDTAAINSAIAAGAVVYFPPGTYKYVGPMTLTANKSYRIYGDGPGVSTILFVGPNAGITVTHTGIATLNVDGLTFMASTTNCGTAINASFANTTITSKFHTATIHNVQIIGTTRDGTSGGYWTYGIHLYRANDSVIDKVEISGNKNLTQTGITWDASTSGAAGEIATGIQLTSIEVKWCNIGLATNGWIEGLYMTGFEFVSCGRMGLPALSLNGTTTPNTSAGAFQLVNGLVDSVGAGISMSNFIYGKVSNVSFRHNGSEVADGTLLSVTNVKPLVVSECSFYGTSTNGPYENGIFLVSSTRAQISGNNFTNMQSQNSGSAIVVYTGSSVVRITDNLFSNVRSQYYDIGPDTYYFGNNP